MGPSVEMAVIHEQPAERFPAGRDVNRGRRSGIGVCSVVIFQVNSYPRQTHTESFLDLRSGSFQLFGRNAAKSLRGRVDGIKTAIERRTGQVNGKFVHEGPRP